jgi:hypothetical protein
MRHHSPLQFFFPFLIWSVGSGEMMGVVISSQASWKKLVVEEEDIVTELKPDK